MLVHRSPNGALQARLSRHGLRTAPKRSSKASRSSTATACAKRLAVTVTTRNAQAYRDAAVLLIDQLKEIYVDAELDAVETAN